MSFEEKLIEEVRLHECLYNLNHMEYKMVHKKNFIWKEIAERLGSTEESCKKKWKGLRDTYKKMKRMYLLPSGSSQSTSKKWKFFDLLLFLDDFDFCRKGVETFFVEETLDVNISPELFYESFLESEDVSNALSPKTESPNSDSPRISENEGNSSGSSSKKRNSDDLYSFLKSASEAIEKIANQPSSSQNSPIEAHFLSLAQRIESANISEREKLLIEKEVSQWVLERLYNLHLK